MFAPEEKCSLELELEQELKVEEEKILRLLDGLGPGANEGKVRNLMPVEFVQVVFVFVPAPDAVEEKA